MCIVQSMLCVCMCCWSLMSSPITYVNNDYLCTLTKQNIDFGSWQSSSWKKTETEKKEEERERAKKIVDNYSDAATVDGIAHLKQHKCHYHVLVQLNRILCVMDSGVVSHIFSNCRPLCHFISNPTQFILFTFDFNVAITFTKFPCQLLIFDLLFGRTLKPQITICSLCICKNGIFYIEFLYWVWFGCVSET